VVVASAAVFSTVRRVNVGVATYFLPIIGCSPTLFEAVSTFQNLAPSLPPV
jgi:hypothetical protein